MPSLSSSLPQLRKTLASLESYELPDRYKPLSSSSSSSSSPSSSSSSSSSSPSAPNAETPEIIDPQLFQRYLKAKDSYIRRRVKHSFIEHLSSLQYSNKENEPTHNSNSNNSNSGNNSNNNNNPLVTISLPPIPTPQEQQTMDNNEQNVKNELLHNIRYIRKGYDNVYHKYKLLNDKKEDMRLIIQSLEEKSKQTDITIDHDDDDDNYNDNDNDDPNIDIDPNDNANATIQESELTMEEEKLQTLRQQKSMLQMKLHRLQLDKELIKSNIERDYGKVKDLMDARNCGGGVNGSANASANASANGSSSSNSNSSNNEADTKSATNTPIKQDRISSSTSNPTPTPTSISDSLSTSTSTSKSTSTSASTKSINLENIQNLPSLEEIEKETHQLQEQFHNYRDMSDYYDSMKCAMETIGGMKILSITPVFADTTMSTATTTSTTTTTAATTTTTSSAAVKNDKKKMEEDEIMTSPCSSPNTSPMKNTTNAKSFNSSSSGSGSKLKKLSPPMNRRGRRQSISPNKVGSGSSSGSSPGANGSANGSAGAGAGAGGSTSDERKALLMRKKNKNNDSINLKVVLLDCHIINLTLTTIVSSSLSSSSTSSSSLSSKQQNSHPQEEHSKQSQSQPMLNYRVTAAKFETPTIVTDTIHDVSMTIPPLDDLVNLCNSLKPLHDIRFILREAMARIRIISQRVDELAQLRVKYLTKITNPMKNKIKFGYGGEYQEIVCSLPCQITVVLRLTCDCPLLDGSAFIHQIVGVGGWNSSSLEKMKKKVNMKKWRSPMQVMDSLEEEIKRIVKDEGICLPKTPTLPKRLKK